MIQVRFRPAPDVPWIRVDVPDEKLEAVLRRAGERIFPGPVNPALEAESEMRWRDVMTERARREKVKK